MLSVRPNGCNHPNSAIPRTRGVEDAAPYGREENHGIRIVANKRIDAANVRPPLGSPERGAVAARRAVTEGLVPAWVQCNNVARQPHPTVGAGFHARPAWDEGQRGCARNNGARAVPAGFAYVGLWTRGWRAVGDAGAVGQAEQLRLTRPGNPATAAHRGRCALRRVGNVSALQIRHPSTNGRGVGDAAPYGGCEGYVSAEP